KAATSTAGMVEAMVPKISRCTQPRSSGYSLRHACGPRRTAPNILARDRGFGVSDSGTVRVRRMRRRTRVVVEDDADEVHSVTVRRRRFVRRPRRPISRPRYAAELSPPDDGRRPCAVPTTVSVEDVPQPLLDGDRPHAR